MAVYPALHATPPRRTENPNALRTGYAIGSGIAKRQRANQLVELRRQALEAGMMGDAGGQPDYFSGEGPSPEAGGMGFGGSQGTQGPLGQRPGAGADKRALYKYLAEDPKGAAEMYGAISKMEDREREQGERQTGELGRLLNWTRKGASPLERESRYQQALRMARERGLDVGGASPSYDADEAGAQVAVVTKLSEQFKRAAEARKAQAAESRFTRGEAGKDRRARIKARAGKPLTKAQEANNAETRKAREGVLALRSELQPGESLRDLILGRIQKATNTGRANPNYDPFLARAYTKASERMVGDDPGFDEFFAAMDARVPTPPAPAPVPRPRPAQPAPAGPTSAQRSRATVQGHTPAADLGFTPELGHIPQEAAAYLLANPQLAEQFDAKYGPGTSQTILQTAQQPAPG